MQLSQQHTLLRLIDDAKAIRDFPADFKDTLPDSERLWLENLGVRLIVPITGTRDRLVGMLLLGERMSDEPYSATDRRLLQAIAAQIGLVYENQHLQGTRAAGRGRPARRARAAGRGPRQPAQGVSRSAASATTAWRSAANATARSSR